MDKIILALLLTGCITNQKNLDPDSFYKRDMKIVVNGMSGEGVMVVPKSSSYKIDVEAKGKLDLFTFTTCHREETKEAAWQDKSIFGNKNKVTVQYSPIPGLEDEGSCPLMLGGYEADKGRHSWAFIDFYTGMETLSAKIKCNGKIKTFLGVSTCQSRNGLIQEIAFDEPVEAGNPGGDCSMPKSDDKMSFKYPISEGLCVFAFMSKSGAVHRLTTLGYSEILIRGE